MTETVNIEKTEEKRQELIESILELPLENLQKYFEIIRMMKRAFQGLEISPDDPIKYLIAVKEILERSRFPSMAIINFQVYCRLVAKYHPELSAFEDWANMQAHALISYQGQNREEYVEMYKAQLGYAQMPQTAISVSGSPQAQAQRQQQEKKHFWSRKPKQEGEFKRD